jgi:predicted nucleic acid-binding protein
MDGRRGPGRPRLPRGVIDLSSGAWVPPDAIVLDTSAVVELLLPSQRAHQHWRAFFRACVEHRTSLVFNRLVETELYDAIFNIALRERWGKGAAHGPKRYDGRIRARASRLLDIYRQEWDDLLDTGSTATIEVGDVADQVPELMRLCGMRSHDAVHAATAILAEVPFIATTDSGFAMLPESTLQIVTDPHRVGPMRRRRAQWRSRQHN